jgi:hypothetical protein
MVNSHGVRTVARVTIRDRLGTRLVGRFFHRGGGLS